MIIPGVLSSTVRDKDNGLQGWFLGQGERPLKQGLCKQVVVFNPSSACNPGRSVDSSTGGVHAVMAVPHLMEEGGCVVEAAHGRVAT